MKFCGNCGSELVAGTSFCPGCGTALGNGAEPPQGFAGKPTPGIMLEPAKPGVRVKSSSGIIIVLAVILGIALVGGGIFLAFRTVSPPEHPGDIVYKFCDAVNSKDVDKILSCLDPKYKVIYTVGDKLAGAISKETTGEDKGLQDIGGILPTLGDVQDNMGSSLPEISIVHIDSETLNGDQATVKTTISIKDSNHKSVDQQSVTIQLKKFGFFDGWRITDLSMANN